MQKGRGMNKEQLKKSNWVQIGIIAVLLMIIYKTFDNFSEITTEIGRFLGIISPLLYGILFTYFLYVPYQKTILLYRKVKWKWIANKAEIFGIITIFLLLIVVIVLAITFIVPILVSNLFDLASSLPYHLMSVIDFLHSLDSDSFLYNLNIVESITTFTDNIAYQLNPATIEQFIISVISITSGIFSGIFNVILGIFIALYLMLDRDRIIKFFKQLTNAVIKKENVRNRFVQYVSHANKVLMTFIASKGLDSIINIVVVTTILLIFDVQYALLLGLIAGLFNFIPYLGSLIAVILISAITLLTGELNQAVIVSILLLIFQQIDGNFIEPRIMKTSLRISPILVIVSVLIGGAYFGIVGMFLAVPIVVVMKQLLLEYMESTNNSTNNTNTDSNSDIDKSNSEDTGQ